MTKWRLIDFCIITDMKKNLDADLMKYMFDISFCSLVPELLIGHHDLYQFSTGTNHNELLITAQVMGLNDSA